MSKTGRKRVPKTILRLRGSRYAKDREDDITNNDRPIKPRWLTGAAGKEWRRIVPKLYNLGIVCDVDSMILSLYCKTFADWRDADGQVTDLTITTSNGSIIQHPMIGIRNGAAERLKKIACEIGMTPISRTSLTIIPKQKKNSKSMFFDPANFKKNDKDDTA